MDYFNKEYVAYWKQRVGNNKDGSKVADQDIADFYIKTLEISKADKVLDLGCGHGRFFPILSKYSENVFGLDVTVEAINAAAINPYMALVKGTAENSNFADKSFNTVIAWGVFDVVEQERGFLEVNRILKENGKFLVTGKNNNYSIDDNLAFIAERNAKLKNFPNHFTDVYLLIANIEKFGFKVVHAFAFKKRGDLGENTFVPIVPGELNFEFYEFVLIMQKITNVDSLKIQFCNEFSNTAIKLAKENNFESPLEYFKWHKQNQNV